MRKQYLLLMFILVVPLLGENMWESHGHNYSYHSYGSPDDEKVIFPVVWDIRSANDLVLIWQKIFGISGGNPIYSILEESFESGFNTALVRAELTDKWFPDQPGAVGDKFFPLAGAVRDIGLHLMVGGLKTDLYEQEHNQAALDYLKLYIPLTAGDHEGDVIGCFTFDEPDVKYVVFPEQADQWIDFVSYWNETCRQELDLPVLSYFARYGTKNSEGYVEYFTDTTSVLNRMSRFTDMVGMDMYPVKNNSRRTDLLNAVMDDLVFTAATDLVQNDPLQIQALNSKDEVIRIFVSGDSAEITVDNVLWAGMDLSLETCWSAPLPFLPDFMAASDFRAGYAVQEAPGYVNSGVVLWKQNQSVDEAVVLISHGGIPLFSQLPAFSGSSTMTPLFFCVGQTDYWADLQEVDGIIGHGRLAILAGLENSYGDRFLMLYTASAGGSSTMETAFDIPIQLDFQAEIAIWGTFWGTWYETGTAQTVASSGFVIVDDNGDYITLNQISREQWQLFPSTGASRFSDLFGSSEMPDIIRICRIDSNSPPFFAGRDLLVGWFSSQERIVAVSSPSTGEGLSQIDSIAIQGLPGEVTGFDLFHNDYRYFDSLVFTLAGGHVYSGTSSMDTGVSTGTVTVSKVNYCNGDTVLTGVRVMHTRDSYRSVLIPSEEGYYIPLCEIYNDKVDQWRFQWYPEVHQVGMDLGVKQTDRDNTLFAVVQSYGRHGFALPSYCASPDTMLYLVAAPIVAGARGFVFYALDISMMSGNGGDDGYSRAPFLLQNWGPSRDTENVDMVGVVHNAVASLTGNAANETDYLSALVDTTWRVMDQNAVFNRSEADTLLNFIALENSTSDTILVIAVNESTSQTPFDPGIVFADLPSSFGIVSSEGFTPGLIYPVSGSMLELDYSAMDGVTASLITLASGSGQQGSGWFLSTATSSLGITSINFSLPLQETGELVLYDLAGRKIKTLWIGTGNGFLSSADVEKGEFPAGLYFVTLTGENTISTGKCLLW